MGAIKCDLYPLDKDTLCAVHWFDKDTVESDEDMRMKQRFRQSWDEYLEEQIIIALLCAPPRNLPRYQLRWSSKLALWSFGLNLFRGE